MIEPTQITPAVTREAQLRAQAAIIELQRRGEWTGAVQAHTEYQRRPLDWIVEKLEIPRETLIWSLAGSEYESHQWDGDKDPLAQILEALANWEDVGVESATGTGKAQTVDTPVLTPTGWRRMGDLRPGDYVIGSNGCPTEVLKIHPQGVLPVYRLTFSDGATTQACAEHWWVVESKHDRLRALPRRLVQTKDLVSLVKKRAGWRVPLPDPVEFDATDLPVDPYVLGVLLGDGGITVNVTLASADQFIVDEVARRCPGVTMVPLHGQYGYGVRYLDRPDNPIMTALRGLGLMGHGSHSKFVPDDYLHRASAAQRLALLRGLMDTDGTVSKREGTAEFYTVSEQLADNVVELARSLGGVANKRAKNGSYKGERHTSWRVTVKMPPHLNPFLLPRKADLYCAQQKYPVARIIDSVVEDGEAECVCITVDALDALYVTEDYVVTHNSFLAACIVFWFLACHENSIVPTVAPKEDQLLKAIWKEIGNLWPRFQKHFPQAQLLTGMIRMLPDEAAKDKWSAFAFVCGVGANEESATKAQGFHAEHMLIITEETPGIHPAIMNALFNTRTDDHNLQLSLGNPDHRQDALHQVCMSEGVRHIRISALDHPNIVTGRRVVPGTFGPKRLQQRINKLGKGSRLYESRVRGVSPSEAEEALIKWDWCVAAANKYEDQTYREGALALGVDVANSPDGDKGAIARWQGACCTEVEDFACPDANLLGKRVYDEAMDPNSPVDPRYIGVDEVGVGAGTVNEMRRLGMKVRKIGSGTKAIPGLDTDTLWSETAEVDGKIRPKGPAVVEAERFVRLRDQVWWRLREDLRLGRIALPNDESLFQDLTTPTYSTKNGKIVVESKEDIVKRLKRSPNKGDACAYGNWVRRRIPLRTAVAKPSLENTRNVDRGLERMIARREKQAKIEKRQMERALRRRRRPA